MKIPKNTTPIVTIGIVAPSGNNVGDETMATIPKEPQKVVAADPSPDSTSSLIVRRAYTTFTPHHQDQG